MAITAGDDCYDYDDFFLSRNIAPVKYTFQAHDDNMIIICMPCQQAATDNNHKLQITIKMIMSILLLVIITFIYQMNCNL